MRRRTLVEFDPSGEQRRLENLKAVALSVSRGDSSAFRRVVAATSARLVRVAARILGSQEEAEDVVQESYLKAYRALVNGEFEERAEVSTWLYRIVTNGAIDALRGRGRRPIPTETLPEATFDGAASAEAHLALRELEAWLGVLPPEQRVALVLKTVEGLSSTEIAEVMGTTEGAVEQKLVRARVALKRSQDHE